MQKCAIRKVLSRVNCGWVLADHVSSARGPLCRIYGDLLAEVSPFWVTVVVQHCDSVEKDLHPM